MIKFSTIRLTNEGIPLEGEEKPNVLDIGDDQFSFEDPVQYRLHAALAGNGALVTGWVRTRVGCACGRCLEPVTVDLECSDVCHFFPSPLPPELDLTEVVREDILIALPQNIVCEPDCKGLCPSCGRNRNVETCSCHKIPEEGNIWSELDRLRH